MSEPTSPEPSPSPHFWWKFFGCLLGPAAMTCVAVAADWEAVSMGAMGASFLTPLACAWMLAKRLTRSNPSFGVTFLGLAVLLVPLSTGLCFGGCVMGAKFIE